MQMSYILILQDIYCKFILFCLCLWMWMCLKHCNDYKWCGSLMGLQGFHGDFKKSKIWKYELKGLNIVKYYYTLGLT